MNGTPLVTNNQRSTNFVARALLGALLVLLFPKQLNAAESVDYNKVKAAFVFNAARFIRWTDTLEHGEFVIGVYGSQELANILSRELKGKEIRRRPIVVIPIDSSARQGAIQIALIARELSSSEENLLTEWTRAGTLTIGDFPRFIDRGGAIGIYVSGNRIKFEVNWQVAKEANLVVHSSMLSLAERILN